MRLKALAAAETVGKPQPDARSQPDRVYINRLSAANRIGRQLWGVVWLLLYRPSPVFLHGWRRLLLRVFGARIEQGAHPYPRCRIWAPWNLTMGRHSGIANDVDVYAVAPISVGAYATVSQYAHLCAATHDYEDPSFRLLPAPIVIGARAWVAAGAFLCPGVTIGEGAVVGARSVVTRDVTAWTVVAGNPARVIKRRLVGDLPFDLGPAEPPPA